MNVLLDFKDRLLTVTDNLYHYEAPKGAALPYVIWQEVGGHSLYGDNKDAVNVYRVHLDIYSEDEFDPLVESVLNVLRDGEIAFDFPFSEYDNDLKLIRTIIECEVV